MEYKKPGNKRIACVHNRKAYAQIPAGHNHLILIAFVAFFMIFTYNIMLLMQLNSCFNSLEVDVCPGYSLL